MSIGATGNVIFTLNNEVVNYRDQAEMLDNMDTDLQTQLHEAKLRLQEAESSGEDTSQIQLEIANLQNQIGNLDDQTCNYAEMADAAMSLLIADSQQD